MDVNTFQRQIRLSGPVICETQDRGVGSQVQIPGSILDHGGTVEIVHLAGCFGEIDLPGDLAGHVTVLGKESGLRCFVICRRDGILRECSIVFHRRSILRGFHCHQLIKSLLRDLR